MPTMTKPNPSKVIPTMKARCIRCQRVFTGPNFAMVGSGITDPEANKLAQFSETLNSHIRSAHPDYFAEMGMTLAAHSSAMILNCYSSDSEILNREADHHRWTLHQKTLARRISDDELRRSIEGILPDLKTLVAMKDDLALQSNLFSFLRGLRDALEEPGKYPSQTSPVVPTVQ
jgi:hypothetical protein